MPLLLLLLLVPFLTWIGLFIYGEIKKPDNFPPGPSWLPILGSILTVARLKKKAGHQLYLALDALEKEYGPVVGLRLGNDVQVACCSYESIKELMNNDNFYARPLSSFYTARTWGTKRGIIFTDGVTWQRNRTFTLKHLKPFGYGQSTMMELLEEKSIQLVEEFKQKLAGFEDNGKVIDIENPFGLNFISTLWTMIAGKRYTSVDEELKPLEGLVDKFFKQVDVTGTLFSQFPFFTKVAPKLSGYSDYVDIHQQLAAYIKVEVDRHRETFQKGEPRDLIDVYLEELDSKDGKSDFSELDLLAIIMDLFMAGAETTSKTLGFLILYMLVHPEVQVKAREEIDEVVGRNRLPTFQDKPNLPYIEAIVNETLRFFSSRILSIPYRALKTTPLQGYTIPKDTGCIIHLYSCLMKKELWGDPEVFRPERFLNSEGKIVLPDYFVPFGIGPRRCIGTSMARNYIFLMTAALLQNFEFIVPPGQAPPSTKGIDGVTPSPGVYSALVKYRM